MLNKKVVTITILGALVMLFIAKQDSFFGSKKIAQVFSNVSVIQKEFLGAVTVADIIEETNKERIAQGLAPLSTSETLNRSAALKVDDMIKRQYFEHQSPTGQGASDLAEEAGYDYVVMGENLALGDFDTSLSIVEAWMNSEGHRANILSKKYQDIGVSVKRGLYQGKEVYFAVQHFGTSRSVCPTVNKNLKKEIDAINAELKKEEGTILALKAVLEAPNAAKKDTYQADIVLFNTKVDAYNKLLGTSKEKIAIYNREVQNLNKCIATFQ